MSLRMYTRLYTFGRLINQPRCRLFRSSPSWLFPKIVPYILSDIGEGIVEVIVKEWYVKPGDKVAQFDPVCEVQSDKASVTITSRFDGQVDKIHYDVDAVAKVGAALLDISVQDENENVNVEPIPNVKPEIVPDTSDRYFKDKALATPAVRRIARENKIDLSKVAATGKAGRILKEDILQFLNEKSIPIEEKNELKNVATGDWREELTGVRKAMVKTMTEAWKIPHLTYSDEIDMTNMLKFRERARLDEKAGVKVTYMPFLLKAVSMALSRYPRLNAQLDESGSRLTVHGDHNLGIAMDTPAGLLVPNVKKVQQLSVVEIARELNRLQSLGQQGRLTRQDLSDGTLTLSNIGAIGGVHANPIILPPQIVIAALGKIQKLPRFDDNNQLVAKDLAIITWAADHRALDGASVARFSNLFKLYVSTPELLLTL